MLKAKLQKIGANPELISFPRYHTKTGRLIVSFLHGKLKIADTRLVALLYAMNRYEYKDQLLKKLEADKIIICDRYVGSNLIHQAIRNTGKSQKKMEEWIKKLEFQLLELPKPDFTIYLEMPIKISMSLVKSRRKDVLELDSEHQKKAYDQGKKLARADKSWKIINCMAGSKLLSRAEIHERIFKEVEKVI